MFFGIHFCSDRLQNGTSGRISLIRIKNQLRIFRKFIDSRIQKPRKESMTAKLRIREGRAFIEQALYRDKSDGGDDGTVVFKIEKEISLIKRERKSGSVRIGAFIYHGLELSDLGRIKGMDPV